MPALVDNMYYYLAYGLILVAFVVVLKTPKKKKPKADQKDVNKEDNEN